MLSQSTDGEGKRRRAKGYWQGERGISLPGSAVASRVDNIASDLAPNGRLRRNFVQPQTTNLLHRINDQLDGESESENGIVPVS